MRQVKNLWSWLTRPAPRIRQADERRQTQLLASMLLIIVPLGLVPLLFLSLNPTARELIGGPELSLATGIGLFAIFPYLLNRQGNTHMAARLIVYFVALAIYIVALDPGNPQGINSMIRLLLPVIVGAIFLSLAELVLLVIIITTATVVYPLFVPQVGLVEILAGPLIFLIVGSALIILFAHHRNHIESDRQRHLVTLEKRYRHIFDVAFDIIMVHRQGRLLDASENFTTFFGREFQTGLALADLLIEPVAIQADNRVSQAQIMRQDGSMLFAEIVTVDQTHDGELAQVTALRDVSRARRVENALRESEGRFRAVVDRSPDFIYIWERRGERLPYFNHDGFMGYTREELVVPGYLASVTHPDDWSVLQANWQAVLEGETVPPLEYRVRHNQGQWEWLERWATILTWDALDQPDQILVTMRIITDRKQAEADMRRRERENRALLEAIPDLIILVDRDGRYLEVWPSKKQRDYRPIIPAEELIGKTMVEALPADVAQPILEIIQAVLDDGEMRQYAYRLPEHGVWRYYEASWVRYNPNEVLATVRDVTDRHQDEARLRREASIFQNLVEAIIITEYIDGEFRIQSVNQAAEEMYGWRKGEAIGEFFNDIVQPIYPNGETRSEFKRLLFELGHWQEEQVHHRRDGRQLHVFGSVTLLRDDSGEPSGAVTIVLDVTRRKQAEHDLYLTEARLQSALRSTSIVVSNQDTDLRYTWIHMSAHNFDSSQIIGKRDQDLLEQPDDVEKLTRLKQQVITSGAGIRREVQVWERGADRVYDLSVEPLCDESGRVIGITCVQVDMTERVHAEQARQKIQQLLQTVISNMPIIVWATDYDGTVTLSEGMGLRRINQEPGQIVGESIWARYADYPELSNNMRRGLAGEAFTAFHETNGIQYQTHYHPAYNQWGRVVGLLGVTIDMTERASVEDNRLQLALERERIELIQRFVGDVSHDFRTPLTSIKLSTHLLTKAQNEADRHRHADVIERQANRLERLMGDLFNMSRLDKATTNEYDFGRVNLNNTLQDIITAHAVFVQVHGHTVVEEFDDDLPWTFGDRPQLDRVFTNLLVNAVNYTPQDGTITIRTLQQAKNLIVEFSDTGIGIAEEKLDLIFNRFYRADPARGTNAGGMGVGLAIARKIVEAHGGTIEVESEPDVGSTFRVILPHISGSPESIA